jgi:hypothetical protein
MPGACLFSFQQFGSLSIDGSAQTSLCRLNDPHCCQAWTTAPCDLVVSNLGRCHVCRGCFMCVEAIMQPMACVSNTNTSKHTSFVFTWLVRELLVYQVLQHDVYGCPERDSDGTRGHAVIKKHPQHQSPVVVAPTTCLETAVHYVTRSSFNLLLAFTTRWTRSSRGLHTRPDG